MYLVNSDVHLFNGACKYNNNSNKLFLEFAKRCSTKH